MYNRLQLLYLSNTLTIAAQFSLKALCFIDQISFERHDTNPPTKPNSQFLPNGTNCERDDILL